ncbi:hypothetical protein GCM10022252_62370 [Streptosporangium oxazolinicum]|uniref:Ferredoxin n=1 Tax=Streptosporangium oxazolinicum TaxID=909287 RepID=A0ABP8BD47_9ACTN
MADADLARALVEGRTLSPVLFAAVEGNDSFTQGREGIVAIEPEPLKTGSEGSDTEVSVNTDLCVGAGQCVLAAAEVFDQGADGLVVLLTATPPPFLRAAVRQAARQCPSGAVTLDEGAAH